MDPTVVDRQYAVSRMGQTTGVVVLRWRTSLVTIMVMPKFWRAPGLQILDLGDLPSGPLVVKEMGKLVVRGQSQDVAEVATSLERCSELTDADDLSPDGGVSRLFTLEATGGWDRLVDSPLPAGALTQFWSLALRFADRQVLYDTSLRALQGQADLAAYLTTTGLNSVPALNQALCQLFVAQCATALRGRPPQFTSEVELRTNPRGRILVSDLPRASRRIVPSVACESGTLSRDDPWTRLILCGLRVVSGNGQLQPKVRRIALSLSRDLHEVTHLEPSDAWNDVRGRPVPRKFRRLALVSRLAEAIIRRDPAFGDLESAGRQAVTATLLVSTSKLFECVLEEAAKSLGLDTRRYKTFGIWEERTNSKVPDLLVLDPSGNPRVVIDGKYKSLDHMDSMPMGDQYQQFAYAAIAGAPALFCYAGGRLVTDPATGVELRTANTEARHRLGCAGVAFPQPEEVAEGWWVTRAASQLERGLAAIESSETVPTSLSDAEWMLGAPLMPYLASP